MFYELELRIYLEFRASDLEFTKKADHRDRLFCCGASHPAKKQRDCCGPADLAGRRFGSNSKSQFY